MHATSIHYWLKGVRSVTVHNKSTKTRQTRTLFSSFMLWWSGVVEWGKWYIIWMYVGIMPCLFLHLPFFLLVGRLMRRTLKITSEHTYLSVCAWNIAVNKVHQIMIWSYYNHHHHRRRVTSFAFLFNIIRILFCRACTDH